jgi:hypothetical protein
VRRKTEGDQPQRQVTGIHTPAAVRTQRPVSSAPTIRPCRRLGEQRTIEDLNDHHPGRALRRRRHSPEPPPSLKFVPRERITIEAKAAQDAGRQANLPFGVHAQCALHGEEPGRSSDMGGQGCSQVAEHLSHPNLVAWSFGTSSASTQDEVGRRSGRTQEGFRDHGGLLRHRRAGRTGIREAPEPSTSLAGEKQTDGAGTAPVTGVPAAATLVTLAGAQVRRQNVAAGMSSKMLKHRGARGHPSQQHASVIALPTHELRPPGAGPQLHSPGTPRCRACCAEPHGRALLPIPSHAAIRQFGAAGAHGSADLCPPTRGHHLQK